MRPVSEEIPVPGMMELNEREAGKSRHTAKENLQPIGTPLPGEKGDSSTTKSANTLYDFH